MLDIGAGTGDAALQFLSENKKVTALDIHINERFLKHPALIHSNSKGNLEVIEADFCSYQDFHQNYFDCI